MTTPKDAGQYARTTNSTDNPFVDPLLSFDGNRTSFAADATLAVASGRASLTLATNELVVLDENFERRERTNCWGLWPSNTANTRTIPFYNVLWAELQGDQLSIDYASPASKTVVRAANLKYPVEGSSTEAVNNWAAKLVDRAYGESQKKKRAKILVNPHSGKGSADKWYRRDAEPLLQAARCSIDLVKTRHSGEAVGIAEKLDIDAFDIVACCSGDGLPHEVFNGLGKRRDARKALSKVAVVNLPGGSGNAMSWNLTGTSSMSLATLAIIKGIRTPLDLISITQGETRILSFLSQALGIVAECDLATEHIRWMGEARFTYGFLIRLLNRSVYPCDLAVMVAIPDKPSIKLHYQREKNKRQSESECRGYGNFTDDDEDDASASSGNEEGLPPLKWGTINDKLPDDWQKVSYDKMGNFYCGNMAYMSSDANFFPAALPNDGCMDLINIDFDVSRIAAVKMMLGTEDGTLFDMPLVSIRKILAYRITPRDQNDGYISIDGERIPFKPFQAEVHKGLGTVLTKSGHIYEAPGPV